VSIKVEVQEDHLRIRVEDDGSGLPAAVRKALRTDYDDVVVRDGASSGGTGGAGGGLANVRQRLLLRYRGEASLEATQLGPGTRIEVRLPL
jgi:signal transduction histidine kinase